MGVNRVSASLGAALVTLLSAAFADVSRVPSVFCDPGTTDSIYSYTLPDITETQNISLSSYNGKQEPGNNATEIQNGIKYVRPGNGFVPHFQLFKKIQVNGETEEPLYTFLKRQCPPTRDGYVSSKNLYYSPIKNNDVRWNFEKFLIDKNGRPYKRYDPSTEPATIRDDIEYLIRNTRNTVLQAI